MQSTIWIPPSNRIDSEWLTKNDCVWEGPDWLKSKQCLRICGYLKFEPLFKSALQIPDASERNVIDDLLILKMHTENQKLLRNQSINQDLVTTVNDRSSWGTAVTPYRVTTEKQGGSTQNYQSIAFMREYEGRSFEVRKIVAGVDGVVD